MLTQAELVVVVDFGAQYGQLIARRVREMNVYCEIWPYTTAPAKYQERNVKGIIFSGGPSSVYAEGAPRVQKELFELGIPVFGICYGMQLMSHVLGGDVRRPDKGEYGKAMLSVRESSSPIFAGIDQETQVWMSHFDSVLACPPGFKVIGSTENTPAAMIGDDARKLYGVQFHPEVVHSTQGKQMMRNFLFEVCGLSGDWTTESFVEEQVQKIRAQVGSGKVLCALSGGVDSSVAAVLVHKAIGDQLVCMYVDHGLMRKGESEQVVKTFRDHFHINLIHVDASERFLGKLAGVTDPEQKRKIIGNEFIYLFQDEARKLGKIDFLVQGTLYPDVVESGTETAAVIKSHHNVGGLPEDMEFALIEPFRELFKDEVRAVGRMIGVPEEIVARHPFPGPGLAIRVLGEITREKLDILRDADAIYLEEIRKAGLYNEIWQAFAALPNIRSVGVMGDERTYQYPIILRAVTSEDGMTSDFYRFPWEVLERITNRIINEVAHVNRVTYDLTSKPPGTIEWE
ncbi:MAG TPA: glutamine-hydrolyzing GMP synthase [Symbiobacteriaceae bacterium]|nr:glutamine-hydrolyzing GMP synthase [Symbiobacteriaceae bacterium]